MINDSLEREKSAFNRHGDKPGGIELLCGTLGTLNPQPPFE